MLDPSRIRVAGPLADHAEGFRDVLADLGYSPRSLWDQTYVLARLGRWLVTEDLAPAELTPDTVDRFIEVRQAAGHRRWASLRSLAPMLNHLEQIGAIPSQQRQDPSGPVEDMLTDCRHYLLVERRLAPTTVRSTTDVARRFLTQHLVRGELDVTGLEPADVTGFILGEGRHRSVGAMKVMVTSLRSFLRFLFVTARTSRDLTTAVPAIAGWSLAGLPKGIDAATFTALLNSCDQRGPVGLRDRAILTLMGRLGLRAAEVAALQLDDIA
jgi:integrase/recombinase XerD